jgi:ATP-binding cassette subfamily B multidrug efflux pump
MSDFREEEKLGKVYDAQLTRRLLKYLRPYRWWVAGRFDDASVSRRWSSSGPTYSTSALTGTSSRDSRQIPLRGTGAHRPGVGRGLFLGSLLASFGLQYFQVRIMQWVGQETMYDLRKEIFEHLQRLPMSFLTAARWGGWSRAQPPMWTR